MVDKEIVITTPVQHVTPVIKIVGDSCNLRCDYCFYHNHDQEIGNVMPIDLLEKFIKEYLDIFVGGVCFTWHGGEPLLAGTDFFRHIVEFEKRYALPTHCIRNAVQTNAVLIDDQWAEFFKENKFGVGISLDDSRAIHDRFRRTVRGTGAFDLVVRGLKTLRRHGIEPGIIQTVTHSSVQSIREGFDSLVRELGCKCIGINLFYNANNDGEMSGESLTNEDVIEVFKVYYKMWLENNDPSVKIRELTNLLCGVLDKHATACNWNGGCTGFICVDYDGSVYPSCDRMSNRPELIIGNLRVNSLEKILNSQKRIDYSKRVNQLPNDCIACEWLWACRNGCTMHRDEGLGGRYAFCSARKDLFRFLQNEIINFHLNPKESGDEAPINPSGSHLDGDSETSKQ